MKILGVQTLHNTSFEEAAEQSNFLSIQEEKFDDDIYRREFIGATYRSAYKYSYQSKKDPEKRIYVLEIIHHDGGDSFVCDIISLDSNFNPCKIKSIISRAKKLN